MFLTMLSARADESVCDCNPISSGIKFEQEIVNIYLDKDYGDMYHEPNLLRFMRGNLDEAVADLNEQLVNIQLNVIQTDEQLSLNELADNCSAFSNQQFFTCLADQQARVRRDYKNGITFTEGSNSGSLDRYCSNGTEIDIENPCEDTILWGRASVSNSNINNYDSQTRTDIIRHELMHALGLPHSYGPYQVQGFFDFMATATPTSKNNWKRFRVPNMDPIINTFSHGLKQTDIQNIQDKYGSDGSDKRLKVNLIQEDGSPAVGMNVALIHRKNKFGKSTARSSYNGISYLATTKGRYFIIVRPVPVARGANSSSGVEGERTPFFTPTSQKTRYVCKRNKKTKIFKLCDNKKRAIKLKREREITIEVNADEGE